MATIRRHQHHGQCRTWSEYWSLSRKTREKRPKPTETGWRGFRRVPRVVFAPASPWWAGAIRVPGCLSPSGGQRAEAEGFAQRSGLPIASLENRTPPSCSCKIPHREGPSEPPQQCNWRGLKNRLIFSLKSKVLRASAAWLVNYYEPGFSGGGIRKSAKYSGSAQPLVHGAAARSKACSNSLSALPENSVRARNV